MRIDRRATDEAAASSQLTRERHVQLSLRINERDITIGVRPADTLAAVIRDRLGLTGTKIGCDRGACSACTVWIDGEVAASCMTFALDVRGKHITTIEGL